MHAAIVQNNWDGFPEVKVIPSILTYNKVRYRKQMARQHSSESNSRPMSICIGLLGSKIIAPLWSKGCRG